MIVKVIDASAAAAILFREPEGPAIVDLLRGATLVAPTLLSFELANICVKKCRRAPEARETLLAAFALRDRLLIEETPVDPGAVTRLALEHGLSAYDASYLWLAKRLGKELVTLDQRLARAAAAND